MVRCGCRTSRHGLKQQQTSHYDLFVVFVACHGPALDFLGLRWPLLAIVCPSWVVVGLCWPLLAHPGPLLVFVGLHWPSLAHCGPVLAFVGSSWACVGFRINIDCL